MAELVGRHRLLYDFDAQNDSEVSAKTGDIVNVRQAQEGGWVLVEFNGKVGLVPEAYVEKVPEEAAPAGRPTKPAPTPTTPPVASAEPAANGGGSDSEKIKRKVSRKEIAKEEKAKKKEDKEKAKEEKDKAKEDEKKAREDEKKAKEERKKAKEDEKKANEEKKKGGKKTDKAPVQELVLTRTDTPPVLALPGTPVTTSSTSPPTSPRGGGPPTSPRGGPSSPRKDSLGLSPRAFSEAHLPSRTAPMAVDKPVEPNEPATGPAVTSPSVSKRPMPSLPKRSPSVNALAGSLPKSSPSVPPKPTFPKGESPPVPPKAKKPDGPPKVVREESPSRASTRFSGELPTSASPPPQAGDASPSHWPNSRLSAVQESDSEADSAQKRMYIVKELFTTEKSYVAGLRDAIEKYYKPLLAAIQVNSDCGLAADDVKLIFAHLENLLPLNTGLFQQLEERINNWGSRQTIGDVFVKFAPFLKLYSTYSNQYDRAVETLDKLCKNPTFVQICSKKSNVENLIITPIQRIPRYTLLLQDLLKKTAREHPDYNDLDKSLSLSKEVADHVNKSINTYKNVARLTEAGLSHLLAPHRFLVKEGPLCVISPDSPPMVKKRPVNFIPGMSLLDKGTSSKQKRKLCHFLLFNDMLVWIDEELDDNLLPKKKARTLTLGKGNKNKNKHHQWPLYLCWLKDIGLRTGFELVGPTKTLSVYFDSPDQRDDWWTWLASIIRQALVNQPGYEDKDLAQDASQSILVRFGKMSFHTGDIYEGWWSQGKIHGEGRMDCFGTTYIGNFDQGFRNGTGRILYVSGPTYIGAWRNGRPSGVLGGTGELKWTGHERYKGEFKEGKRYGKGVMVYANGDSYDGEWKNDVPNGAGTLKLVSGVEYTGGFQEAKFHGTGTLKIKRGVYEGSFVAGLRSGRGTMKLADGTYDGDWKDDKRHGPGKWVSSSGSYEGEWKNDCREGKGVMKFANGDVYDGHWSLDKEHGQGIWTSEKATMRKYEGEWNAGRRQGKATVFFANGDKYTGDFADNAPHGSGKMLYANGSGVEAKWVNGVKEGKTTVTWNKGGSQTFEAGADDPLAYIDPPTIPVFELSPSLFE